MITAAALTCPVIPQEKKLAMVAVDSFEKCVEMLKLAKGHFRDSLSAFEVMDRHSTMITFKAFPDGPKYPFSSEHPFSMLLEVEAYDENDPAEERLLAFLE